MHMNSRDRFVNVLTGKGADRVPFFKMFGGVNKCHAAWEAESPGISKNIDKVLQFEGYGRGWAEAPVNMRLSRLPPPSILSDEETKYTRRNGDGSVEVIGKGNDKFEHTLEYPVKSRKDWEKIKNEFMAADDPGRFPENWEALVKEYGEREYALELSHRGVYGFTRDMLGDENLAFAFYDDPELVRDIMTSYTDMALNIWDRMVKDVEFDLIECWEDMAFRSGAMISPEAFREFMKPVYQRIAAFAKDHNIKIILVDCDGYIEELAGLMLESGVTSMYPCEVFAGNDVSRMLDRYPNLSLMGGLEKNTMAQGKDEMDREVEKAALLIKKGRFIPGPDHFVLSNVPFANYKYFMENLRKVIVK